MSDFHVRVFCECGWSYRPAHDDSAFGPRICPACGKLRGTFPKPWDLEDLNWTARRVREKYEKSKFLGVIPIYTFVGYEDRNGEIISNVKSK